MSKHASERDRQSRASKREQFVGTPPSRRSGLVPLLVSVVVLVVGGGIVYFGLRGDPEQASLPAATPAPPTSETGEIRIPLGELASGQAKFMEHAAAGGPIRFFALKGADGAYRVALDACEICFHGRKGYFQNGDEMVCRQCGNSYPPYLIDEAPGGCHPIRVPRNVDGDHLVVLAADVERIHAEHASRPPMQRRMMMPRGTPAAPLPQVQ